MVRSIPRKARKTPARALRGIQAQPLVGKELRMEQLRATRQVNYVLAHRTQLAAEYSGEWIAVTDGGVLAHAETRERLLSCLKKKSIVSADVYVDFMSEDSGIFVR